MEQERIVENIEIWLKNKRKKENYGFKKGKKIEIK
jgi:hypothetical protein